MPAYGWGGDVGLEQWLFDEPYAFDFFQAVHLLELWSTAGGRAQSGYGRRTCPIPRLVRPELSAQRNPPAQGRDRRTPAEMTVAFSSLGGIDGPLPTSFTEEILRRLSQHDSAAAAFLDIFHHRLISLLYRFASCARRRSPRQCPSIRRGPLSVFADGPRAGVACRPGDAARCAAPLRRTPGHPAPLGDRTGRAALGPFRSAGQGRTVRGRMDPAAADQVTNIGQTGRNNALGRTTTLGTRVWIQDAGVRLHIGPLDAARLRRVPSRRRVPPSLAELVRIYAGADLTVLIRLILRPEAVRRTYLGVSRVGWTSWLARPPPQRPTIRCSCVCMCPVAHRSKGGRRRRESPVASFRRTIRSRLRRRSVRTRCWSRTWTARNRSRASTSTALRMVSEAPALAFDSIVGKEAGLSIAEPGGEKKFVHGILGRSARPARRADSRRTSRSCIPNSGC